MLAAALGMLVAVAVPLGLVGLARERRRRLALVRAGLGPVTPALAAFGLLVQGVLALLLLGAEGASLDPERLVTALGCGLLALLVSAFLFRAARDRVVALLEAFAAAVTTGLPRDATAPAAGAHRRRNGSRPPLRPHPATADLRCLTRPAAP